MDSIRIDSEKVTLLTPKPTPEAKRSFVRQMARWAVRKAMEEVLDGAVPAPPAPEPQPRAGRRRR